MNYNENDVPKLNVRIVKFDPEDLSTNDEYLSINSNSKSNPHSINPIKYFDKGAKINPVKYLDKDAKINPVKYINEQCEVNPLNSDIKDLNSNNNTLITESFNLYNNDRSFILGSNGHIHLQYQQNITELSNFYVIAEKIIISDNGLYQETFYILKCILENEIEEKAISISGYSLLESKWIIEKLGIKYYLTSHPYAYNDFRIYLSNQFLNKKPEFKYDLVGWKYINNRYVYLHGNGAIGSNTLTLKGSQDKKIEINTSLTSYISFEQSLSLLKLSDNLEKTLPLFLYSHLAVMKEVFTLAGVQPKFLLWIYGITGAMKTSVCKMFFNVFNRSSRKDVISATFKDTPAAIEIKAFEYKDSVLLLDDYHPTTSSTEKKAMESLAIHVTRMYGDVITRSRATKTMGKQKDFPPRGLCVITGEDRLGGESTVARYIGIEVTAGDYKTDILSFHQNNPLIFSTHIHSFIYWVSDNLDTIVSFIKENFEKFRKANSDCFRHKRLSESYAILQITAQLLLQYSISIGYLNYDDAYDKFNEWDKIIYQVIVLHESLNIDADPAIMYLQAIEELLATNKCLLLFKNDTSINKSNGLGYKDNENYYLIPQTAFAQVRIFWKGQGLEFPVSNDQVNKALDNLGIIKTSTEGGQTKRTVKATLGNQGRKRYLIIDVKKMTDILNNM